MLFRKKKRMIDVRELQRRGVVRIPKNDIVVPTDSNGFVELNGSKAPEPTSSGSSDIMDSFVQSPTPSGLSTNELDNKIYKLEQRIELLEKKLDVNQSDDTNVGVMGW